MLQVYKLIPRSVSLCTYLGRRKGGVLTPPLEFVHLGLSAKISVDHSPRPLAGEGGPVSRRVGEGVVDGAQRKQPLTPGFAGPSPLGEGRYQLRSHVNPNVETPGPGAL